MAFSAKEHDQIVPYFGWSEQKPLEWWEGAVTDIRSVLQKVDSATHRIAGVAACGQMHATVLIDEEGQLVLDRVPLWNDKRTRQIVQEFLAKPCSREITRGHSQSANRCISGVQAGLD